MSTISDEGLIQYASFAKEKVVVLTGGASGFGKEAAFLFARHGAKLVLGDINESGVAQVAKQINDAGGQAIGLKCNVLSWDDQVAMFEAAMSRFKTVDIVIPNAGVSETEDLFSGNLQMQNGRPIPPKLTTTKINIDGVVYTTQLGVHYMKRNHSHTNPAKSVVLLGSMSSWSSMPNLPLYSSSKHAMLGLMRALQLPLIKQNIRIAVVTPFFSDTGIIASPEGEALLKGLPMVPVSRVAAAMFFAATEPGLSTSGSVLVLPDSGLAFKMAKESLKDGVYKVLGQRLRSML